MSDLTRRFYFGLGVGCALIVAGCAPISEETRVVSTPLDDRIEQEVVSVELEPRIFYEGSDPREDGVVVVELTEHRQCAEWPVTRLKQEEHTTRQITNWTMPVTFGVLGVLGVYCGVSAAVVGGCIPESAEEEEGGSAEPPEPLTDKERYAVGATWGAIAIASLGMLVIDLVRARNTVERLDDVEEFGEARQVACGSGPARYEELEYRLSKEGTPLWRGQTNGRGVARIPMAELEWAGRSRGSAGFVKVEGLGTKSLPPPPQSWRLANREQEVNASFAQAKLLNDPTQWLDIYERFQSTERGDEAFEGFLQSIEGHIEQGRWELAKVTLERARLLAPDRSRERAQGLRAKAALLEARAVVSGEEERSFVETLELYKLAATGISEAEAEKVQREAWVFASDRMRLFFDTGRLEELSAPKTGELIAFFARSEEEQEELGELNKEIGAALVTAALAEAQRRGWGDNHEPERVRDAYREAYQLAVEYQDDRLEALERAYGEASLFSLQRPLRMGNARLIQEGYEEIRESFVGDEEVLRRVYFEFLLKDLAGSLRGLDSSRLEPVVFLLREQIRSEAEELELVQVWFGGLSKSLIENYKGGEPEVVTRARRFMNQESWKEVFPSRAAQDYLREEERSLRRRLARQVPLAELRSVEDVLWLVTPQISTGRQIQGLLDDPSQALNQRALLTFTFGDSLGDGGYLANLSSPKGQVVLYGSRGGRGQRRALVEVIDTLADGRGSGGHIPVVVVLWEE